MEILHFNPNAKPAPGARRMTWQGHEVVAAKTHDQALAMMSSRHFDAVVIDDGSGDRGLIEFTLLAHRLQPELPVFLLSVWGSELRAELQSLAAA